METTEEEEFAGRSVVISGAAGGIGMVPVQRFLTRGVRVFAVDRDQDALDRLQAEHGKSAKLSTVVLDVSDEQAEDLVGAVYFLASEDAAFITGQIINVDGGAEFH
jgi:NAD(P)-dependent dehydrogenase (short-subunit alcohol dehydrogenase family)